MTAALHRWGRSAVTVALLASLVPQALALARHLQTPAPAFAPLRPAAADPGPSNTGIILQAAPFGRPAPAPDAAPGAAPDLVLLGVTMAADPAASRAIIGGGTAGAVASYRVGDIVTGGVSLAAITDDAVEMDDGTRLAFPNATETEATAVPPDGLIDFSGGAAPSAEGAP